MPAPESSPERSLVEVRLKVHGHGSQPFPSSISVPAGTTVREVIRGLGLSPEGHSSWWEGEPVPLDLPLGKKGLLELVGTFSGG